MKSLEITFAAAGGYEPGRYRGRLAFALALSLLIHAFILSLRFGVAGYGLPGVALPWAERRAFSSDLSVRLAETPRARTSPTAPGKIEPVRRPAVRTPAVRMPAVRPPSPRTLVARTPATRTKRRQPRAKAVATRPAAPAEKRARAIEPRAQPELIAQAEPERETFSVPPPTAGVPEPAPAVAARQQVEAPPVREQAPADEEAARRAREQEAARLEQASRQEEARTQEEARAARQALELEARRQAEEAARQQAAALARQRALELEARRQEEAKKQEEAKAARLALELEALKQAEEAARQQAAELARQRELEARKQAEELAARERAAQELAERQRAEALAASQRRGEADRLGAETAPSRAPPGAAEPGRSAAGIIGPTPSGRELAAKALEQLRTPGSARAEPQGPPRPSPLSSRGPETSRRRSILGSVERDIGLRMYIESWRWKIERNGNLNYPSGARTRAAENPVVTVAIRRDGSVESVIIDRTSGLRDLDERVRRIVHLFAPYSVFPPDLARAYDVIELRLVWVFADTLRIVEELR